MSIQIDSVWVQSEQIYINTDIKKKVANSYALPIEGHIPIFLQSESEIVQLILTSSIENKMRLIIISSSVVVVNNSSLDLKVISFCADLGEKLENVKRNELPTRKYREVSRNDKGLDKQGLPIPTFVDLCAVKGKRKINSAFSFLLAIGSFSSEETSFAFKIQPMLRKCLNISTEQESFPIVVSIIKHCEQFFVSIHDDHNPYMSVKNDTDFKLFIAQTDMVHPSTKYVLPHKEVADERFSWFQAVPSKQQVFYTPPTLSELFPEISNPDFGLIFACVTGDGFVRWSQPIKVDGTKKIIINVPMFGDVKLIVDTCDKIVQITISYIQQDKDEGSLRNDPSREFYRAVAQQSFLEVNSNYQKTFALGRKTLPKAFNVNFYSKGVSLTVYKDGEAKRVDQISFNLDDIGVRYSKLECKLRLSFAKIQVDNELYSTGEYDFPVVLCNKDIPKSTNQQLLGTSIWDLNEVLEEQQTHELFEIDIDLYENGSMEKVSLKLQAIRLYIEDTFINSLLGIIDDCLPMNLIAKPHQTLGTIKLKNGMVLIPQAVVYQALHIADPLRLKSIRLEPVHILLSVHTCMR